MNLFKSVLLPNVSRISHKFPSTTGRGELWMSQKFTNPNASTTPQIRHSPQPRQSARCLGVSVVRDPEIATTMAGINTPKKLSPTISSARTAAISIGLLRVAPTACHSRLKFVKQTHPDPQRKRSEFQQATCLRLKPGDRRNVTVTIIHLISLVCMR